MSRRLSGAVAVLAVVGGLAGAAVAYAANAPTSTPKAPTPAPAAYQTMPAASHKGNCPNMGGGPPGAGSSQGLSDSGTATGPSSSGV
jgi:hypothetical protein